jgi:Helix-turn-helix of DDE superfamily endonuclease/DDE superfamily endonuclease
MLFYRAALPLSRPALDYLAGVVRRHRRKIGSCWRKLNPGRQALLVLVHLRKGETFAGLAAGFGVGTTTAWRYVQETVALLAARAPRLDAALEAARKAQRAFVVLDGTLVPIDRLAADRPFYSGKHRKHGMNLQVIASPEGEILWVSGALPGAVHDLTAARIWGIVRTLAAAGFIVLAGKGYTSAGDPVITPTGAGTSQPRKRPPTAPDRQDDGDQGGPRVPAGAARWQHRSAYGRVLGGAGRAGDASVLAAAAGECALARAATAEGRIRAPGQHELTGA